MFYPRRVVDINDGKPKWSGISDASELIADTSPDAVKKRKRQEKDESEKQRQEKQQADHPGDNEDN